MGCAASAPTAEEKEAEARDNEIEKQLLQEKRELMSERTIKLLLLGAGETGKSTILKQMKIIYGVGFTPAEILLFATTIQLNLLQCIKTLTMAMDILKIPYGFDPENPTVMQRKHKIQALEKELNQELSHVMSAMASNSPPEMSASNLQALAEETAGLMSPSSSIRSSFHLSSGRVLQRDGSIAKMARRIYEEDMEEEARQNRKGSFELKGDHVMKSVRVVNSERIQKEFGAGKTIPPDFLTAVEILWSDKGVQYCFSRSNEYQLVECCPYLMKNMKRICAPGFKPTEEDILNARIMTTTVSETRFIADNITYRVFDVGGQRSERRKWAAFFDDVEAIIFLVAISSFDQTCAEAEGMNRMVESINVFSSIVNYPLFKKTGIILFLNKIDLFKEKIKTSQVSNYFPTFKGDNTSFEETSRFFVEKFDSLNGIPNKTVYTHLTWATDTKQITKILKDVRACIRKLNLESAGLE
ncbi:guanine nucleotide-binding protein subunit alpha [Chytriomyces hyalinus]|nr:guanine nucleotide-binding protein subunit alpha [Chytriomyces hyalinus]